MQKCMEKIQLTAQKDGLGWVSKNHRLVNNDYTIQNNFDVYTRDDVRNEAIKSEGYFCCWAYMDAPNRKREVCVSIGFDIYGNYKTSSINDGRGYFPKKVQEMLYNKLIEWMVADGWAVDLEEEDK